MRADKENSPILLAVFKTGILSGPHKIKAGNGEASGQNRKESQKRR